MRASEAFLDGIPSRYEAGSERQLLHSGLDSRDPRKLLEIWHSIVATYTAGALTYTSDKLIAVSLQGNTWLASGKISCQGSCSGTPPHAVPGLVNIVLHHGRGPL